MYPDPQRLENIMSIRDAMRQISQEADAIVELLDARIEAGHLEGSTEAEDVRVVLELIQSLALEVSKDLDAYQERHASP
jgi:hypothetical protein